MLKREVVIHPWECSQSKMFFVVKGRKGAVTFSIFTGWNPRSTQGEAYPGAISVHSLVPIYKTDPVCMEECEWLDNKSCYCDGRSGSDLFNLLIDEGSEAVWKVLEVEYRMQFGVRT